MKYKVSVVIPTFKRHSKLMRAIQSVLRQSITDYEIIVVNDATDDLELIDIITELKKENISLLNNTRTKGANGARNVGILHSNAPYIALLDDDDEWEPSHLQECLNQITRNNKNVSCVIPSSKTLRNEIWVPNLLPQGQLSLEEFIVKNISVGATSVLFLKTNTLKKIGLFDEDLKRHQDLELMIRLLVQTNIYTTEKITVKIYGHNPPSITVVANAKNVLIKKISPYLSRDPKLFRKYKSIHARELALLYFQQHQYKNGIKYTFRMLFLRELNPVKYVRILIIFLDSILHTKLDILYQKTTAKLLPKKPLT